MLVCHCNVISEKEIEEAVVRLLDEDPWQLVVPAKVYHAIDKRGRCCGCFPNVVDIIVRVTEEYHQRGGADPERLSDVQLKLDKLKRRHPHMGGRSHEGRTAGHRTAQRSPVSRAGGDQPVLGALPAAR